MKYEVICCDLIYVSSKVKDVKAKLKVEFWIEAIEGARKEVVGKRRGRMDRRGGELRKYCIKGVGWPERGENWGKKCFKEALDQKTVDQILLGDCELACNYALILSF